MELEPETRRKVEEMVMDLLKQSSIEEATELAIRVAASDRLGIDLSHPSRKKLVRNVVESYLLALAAEESAAKEKPPQELAAPVEPTREETVQLVKPMREFGDGSDRVICQLSNRRNVTVTEYKGKTLVSIREFFHKNGKQLPSPKGISLSTQQWSNFKKNVPAIEEAIAKMEGKMKSELHGKPRMDVSKSVVDVAPIEVVPIEISRFDGKNYQFWATQMEQFLKQLKIDYVLTKPCPNAMIGEAASAEAKATEKRWVNDDLMCRHNILSHLSDHLFNLYVHRKMSAKELWEELKMVYLYEEFGTKREQVKKYIEFQMVEERSVVEQIQELNSITDSLVNGGMFIDENFHVSVILSKLPLSWKDIFIKLIREEHLPVLKLMECIRTEEGSRNGGKRVGEPSSGIGFNHSNKGGPWELPGTHRNRSESNGRGITCYVCGKKGHLSKHCRRRYDKQTNERKPEDVSFPAEDNMVGGS